MKKSFTASGLRLSIAPRRAEPLASDSAEVCTVAGVEIQVGPSILTQGRDGDGPFSGIELPLIDVADWLARSWAQLLYGPAPRDRVGQASERLVSCAEFWLRNRQPVGSIERQERIFGWASHHALEFAATDYVLPNIVFQRVDDDIEASWAASPDEAPGSDVRFDFNAGRILIPWHAFRNFGTALMSWVDQRCVHIHDDPRVLRVRAVLRLSSPELAKQAIAIWSRNDASVASLVPEHEVEPLGRSGIGGPISAFLRSSEGSLPSESYKQVVDLFLNHARSYRRDLVEGIVEGLDRTVDILAPWESGLRLARQVRPALQRLVDVHVEAAPLDIEGVYEQLGLVVHERRWPGERFEGVCLVDPGHRALAIVNRAGRLSRHLGGMRATLAHELCHVLFDVAPERPVGQVERSGRATSPIEKRANAFAAELLLPRAVLVRVAVRGVVTRASLRAIARRYGVGIELARWQAGNEHLRLE